MEHAPKPAAERRAGRGRIEILEELPVSRASITIDPQGNILDVEGEWKRFDRSLHTGALLLGREGCSIAEALALAMERKGAVRFRHETSPSIEWLCVIEPMNDGWSLRAELLPTAPVDVASDPMRWLGSFADQAPFHFGVCSEHHRGRFVVWNAYSQTLFGYAADEAVGQLSARDLHDSESEYLATLAAGDERYDGECTFVRKDGSKFVGRLVVVPVHDERGRVFERCRFVEDLTDRKQAEAALAEAHRVAGHEDRVRVMGELAGGIAHDFNNLLTAIMSSAEMLVIECGDQPNTAEDLAVIGAAARSASSLTRRLLTFTRNRVEAPRSVDVAMWFGELLPFLQRMVPEHVRFRPSLEGKGIVRIDPNELEQVVLNLVINAVRAMPGGGSLVVRCRCGEGRLLIEVEDTGVGMPDELQERVFEPFFTTRAEGTGLGLSTARAIVERVGGEMWVLSASGQGSCFSVSIPLAEDDAPRPRSRPATGPAAVPIQGARVLLVEDQPDVRYAVERLLRVMGYSVNAVPDVRTGKRALEEMEHCHLLLTDYMLPDGTGLDLLEDTRAIFPEALAVMMSGYMQEVEAADRQFDRLIAKPFTRNQLTRVLNELSTRGPRKGVG